MKLSVHLKGEILAVPCGKGNDSVKHLGETALKRYAKLKSQAETVNDKIQEIRRTNGGAIIDQDDLVKDVLDDNDFVTIGKTCVWLGNDLIFFLIP